MENWLFYRIIPLPLPLPLTRDLINWLMHRITWAVNFCAGCYEGGRGKGKGEGKGVIIFYHRASFPHAHVGYMEIRVLVPKWS